MVDPIPEAQVDITPTDELILYIPAFGSIGKAMNSAITLFKKQYPNVNVVSETLGDDTGWGWEEYRNRVNAELMSGSGPDVIVVGGNFFTNPYRTMDSGAFLDLSTLFDTDQSLNPADFNQTILAAGVYKNGRYLIPLSYSVPILTTAQSALDAIGLDISKNTDFVSFYNEMATRLPKAKENKAFVSFFSTSYFYQALVDSGIELVDYESKTILPNETAFKDFCEAYKGLAAMYAEDQSMTNSDTYAAILKGERIFAYDNSSASAAFYVLKIYKTSDIPVLSVVRSMDKGIVCSVNDALAIRASSHNQQNAYNFIKIMLTGKIQNEGMNISGFPVNRKSLDSQVKQANIDNVYMSANTSNIMTKLSADEISSYLALHESVTRANLWDYEGADFCYTAMEPFFSGAKPFDECLDALKKRLSLYIYE
jgi:ABC-type glycerol-3-phosphate transport system substrate-binding protein